MRTMVSLSLKRLKVHWTKSTTTYKRIRELTVSRKTVLTLESDIKSIQEEVGERLKEIDRISEQTQFNGVKYWAAKKKKMTVHAGTKKKKIWTEKSRQQNAESWRIRSWCRSDLVVKASDLTAKTAAELAPADADGKVADLGKSP